MSKYNNVNGQRQILYKFVVYQTKGLVCDEDGNGIFIRPFDKVFADLYGVEDFSYRMSRAYGNRAMRNLIDKIGIEQLVNLFKNQSYCNVVRDLTMISRDLESVDKKIRKCKDSRGRRRTNLVKEHNELIKLYRKGIKNLQKELKIKDISKAYKSKYGHLRNFVGGRDNDFYWDDIDGSFMSEMDDDYDDNYFNDMDYDPDDSTILEDFARELSGGKSSRQNRRRGGRVPSFEYADDPDDELYDDESEYSDSDFDALSDTVKNLASHMQSLTDTVQGLAAQNRYDQVNNRNTNNHRYQKQSNQRSASASNGKMEADMADIKQCMFQMMDKLKGVDDRLADVEDLIEDEDGIGNAYDPDLDPYASNGHTITGQFTHLNSQEPPRQQQNRPQNSTAAIIDAFNNAPELTQDMLDD